MKLLVISYDWPPMIGGKATILHELFSRIGEDISVIAAKEDGYEALDKKESFMIARIPKFFFNIPLLPFFRPYIIKIIFLYLKAKEIALKEKPDLIMCGQLLTEGAVGLCLKKELGIPYIIYTFDTIDVELPLNGRDKKLAKEILLNAEKVVCISSYMKRKLIDIGIEKGRVVMVMPGIDTKEFFPGKPAQEIVERTSHGKNKIVLTVARLVDRKGIDYAINAFSLVKKEIPDSKMVIVGDGPERANLEKIARDLGLENDVVFAGKMVGHELVNYYNASDVFVLPSTVNEKEFKSEGFGVVFLEAAACGKPVIGTRTAGIVDAVEENVTGILVEQRNTGQLADAMIKILSDKNLAQKLGQNGRDRAVREFDWSIVARNFEKNVLGKMDVGK